MVENSGQVTGADPAVVIMADRLGSSPWKGRDRSGLRWPKQFPHRYDNPMPIEQSILCVDRPAFLPHDEVEVETPSEGLQPVAGKSYYPAGATEGSSP